MKIREDIRKLTTTQSNLARGIGLTQPRINQLIDEGVVIRDEKDPVGGVMIFESLRNYYSSKSAKEDGDEAVDFWQEKALHERVKRQQDEIKLRRLEGSVYDAKTVELTIIEILSTLRTHLTAMPAKFAVQLEHKSREEIYTLLAAEIEGKLSELSQSFDDCKFADEVTEKESA